CQWLAKQRYRRPHAMELPALNGLSCPLTGYRGSMHFVQGWYQNENGPHKAGRFRFWLRGQDLNL
ncbi:hypothetical protein NKH70_10945, partial [Mesorhizobium sp. M0991]|uniref:hypothetical protein n=1 Tax=Mesorhizobium sp. M0991 TaxID=2957043 RepID=UPI003337E363